MEKRKCSKRNFVKNVKNEQLRKVSTRNTLALVIYLHEELDLPSNYHFPVGSDFDPSAPSTSLSLQL